MKKNKRKWMTRLVAILVAVALAIPSFSISASAEEEESSDPVVVVSMGDSYSSGEGIEPFYGQNLSTFRKINNSDWLAHRSTLSWPSLLEVPGIEGTMADYKVTDELTTQNSICQWYFVATSGAETKNFSQERQEKTIKRKMGTTSIPWNIYLDKQLDVFDDIEEEVDYVTLTVGGNDVGFSDIIITCVVTGKYLCPNLLSDKIDDLWEDFYTSKDNYTNSISENIKQVYTDIQSAAGSQAAIIVAGYPKLLAWAGDDIVISPAEANKINTNVSKFNKELENIVINCKIEGMNIYFVDVEEEFDGHEAYSDDAWINGIVLPAQDEDLDNTGAVSAYSIHPNQYGAEAYAKCVNAKIKEIENGKKVTCKLTSEDGTVDLSDLSVNVITKLKDGTRTLRKLDGAELVEEKGHFLIYNKQKAVSCQVDVFYGSTLLKRYSIDEIDPDVSEVSLDLSLAYLDVIVNDDSGEFLSNAAVSIYGKEGESGTEGVVQNAVLTTNESGQSVYRLPVTPGTYYVTVTVGDDELAQDDKVVVRRNITLTYTQQDEIDYYQFIHDELLPEMGYASTETATKELDDSDNKSDDYPWNNIYWDQRSGLLGADIIDLNGDDVDELLVYYFANSSEKYSEDATALYVNAYTVIENKITLLSTKELFADISLDHSWGRVCLMEVKGQQCLYVERYAGALWADGFDDGYTWYGMDEDGDFRELWWVGKSDGGSTDFAYSLLDYTEDKDTPVETVIYGDSGWRYENPDVDVLMTEVTDFSDAVQKGFQLLGLEEAPVVETLTERDYEGNRRIISYWPTCEKSCEYTCTFEQLGDNYSSPLRLSISATDYTELKAHIDALED